MSSSKDSKHSSPILRHTVTLAFALNGNGTGDEKGCTRAINVPFNVTDMVVRQVTCRASVTPPFDVSAIECPTLCVESPLCTIPATVGAVETASPGLVFTVPTKISGDRTFRVIDATDVPGTLSGLAGVVTLTLEFRGRL
ncbi:MAG: hypothetical protein NT176_09055 [Proteobacteria bacterium]|nr:hypothetical protein [Pseudomonadota bacterium]